MSAEFEVVHGNPDDEELAVVISLLTAAASTAGVAAAPPARTSNWARPGMRVTLPSGTGAWYSSGLPR